MVSRIFIAAAFALMLSGCIAQTAVDIVTLPVKVASKTVDVLTTSQSEADEKRGREIRKRRSAPRGKSDGPSGKSGRLNIRAASDSGCFRR